MRGRGGRQGDPGVTQFFVSCEDDLMRIFQGDRVKMLMTRLGVAEDQPIQTRAISKTLESAQKRIEGFNFDSRKNVVQYDNVINRHRRVVYMMRRKILEGDDIYPEIKRLMRDEAKTLTEFSSRVNKNFDEEFKAVFNTLDDDLIHEIGVKRKEKEREKLAYEAIEEAYKAQEEKFGAETMRKVEREVYLKVLDMLWMQHLENMQHLREGIHWRSVGQRDPLVEYRSESQKLFDGLQRNLREEVLKILLTITPVEAANDNVTDGEEYESELTKMASGNDKGVNEISAGEKNLDDEFKKKTPGAGGAKQKKATKKSSKKKKSAKKKKK